MKTSRRNNLMALGVVAVVAGMIGVSFAAVPLYQLFCRVTGFGGTTQVAGAASATVGKREFVVTLDGTVNSSLPWRFAPVVNKIRLKIGEQVLVHYRAENLGEETVTGVATFNVTPFKVGAYFDKIQCFCFTQQTLKPGEVADMPVVFFIDPAINDDRNVDDVTDVTLSYTFFRAPSQDAARKEARAPADKAAKRTF